MQLQQNTENPILQESRCHAEWNVENFRVETAVVASLRESGGQSVVVRVHYQVEVGVALFRKIGRQAFDV